MAREQALDWGQRAAWGVALTVVAGGVLNVTATISPTVIITYVLVGVVCWVVESLRRLARPRDPAWRPQLNRVAAGGLALVGGLLGLQFVGWLSTATSVINPHDDLQAYLVFPFKMLEAGALGADPFSYRRLTSGLGGHSFLQTFVLAVGSPRHIHMVDLSLGTVLVTAIAASWIRGVEVAWVRWAALVFIVLTCPPLSIPVNATAEVLPAALLLSLFRAFERAHARQECGWAPSLAIALHVAALCALKSSLIPVAGVLYSMNCLMSGGWARPRRVAAEWIRVTGLIALFLTPWMISMYLSSGTPLYPLLGSGFHAPPDVMGPPWSELTLGGIRRLLVANCLSHPYFVPFLLLAAVNLAQRRPRPSGDEAPTAIYASGALVAIMLCVAFDNSGIRYISSILFAGMTALLIRALAGRAPLGAESPLRRLNIALAVGLVCITLAGELALRYGRIGRNIRQGLSGSTLVSGDTVERYRRAQLVVPAGEVIVTRLEVPFVLDFSRNPIYLVDYPGGAGLPPELPSFNGGEAVADYLMSHDIRYVAYSYATEAGFTRELYAGRLTGSYLVRTLTRLTFDFQENLDELGGSRRRIYDDGQIVVLDLAHDL